MEIFYIAGGILVGWAILVSVLGLMREDFPAGAAAQRVVAAISVILVGFAIGAAIVASINEEHEEDEAAAEHSALLLR